MARAKRGVIARARHKNSEAGERLLWCTFTCLPRSVSGGNQSWSIRLP